MAAARLRTSDTDRDIPFAELEGYAIVGDVRLDARDRLQARLGVPEEVPDVALVLAAYRRWDKDSLDQLAGEFAFAIWDPQQQRVFGARDRFGIKPFYIAQLDGDVWLTNTLLSLPSPLLRDLDAQSITDYLVHDYLQDPAATAFAAVRRIPAAHAITVRVGQTRMERYWTLGTGQHVRYRRDQEYVENFAALMDVAVKERATASTATVMLSGGLDSGYVAALAKRKSGVALRAIHVSHGKFESSGDSGHAALIAKEIGIPLDCLETSEFPLFAGFDPPMFVCPEPANEPLLKIAHAAFGVCARHSPVVLFGHGADELLSPVLLGEGLKISQLGTAGLRHFLKYGQRPGIGLRQWWARPKPSPATVPVWIRDSVCPLADAAVNFVAASASSVKHPNNPVAYRALTMPLWQSLFELNDAGSMLQPAVVRYPYLDLRVVDFVLGIPQLPWTIQKHLLREAARHVLPAKVFEGPKRTLPDLVEARLAARCEQLTSLDEPDPRLIEWVRLERLPAVVTNGVPDQNKERLRVVALNLWLKSLGQIPYKRGGDIRL